MYIARLIQGFGVGFVMTVQPMYIGEIASDSVRGALGSLMQLFITGSDILQHSTYTHTLITFMIKNANFSWNFIRLRYRTI